MDSYKAKIGWKRMRKRENKNYHSVSFLPTCYTKFQKNRKKIKKTKKYHYGIISSRNRLVKAEKERK